jgi:hypothetical protein
MSLFAPGKSESGKLAEYRNKHNLQQVYLAASIKMHCKGIRIQLAVKRGLCEVFPVKS